MEPTLINTIQLHRQSETAEGEKMQILLNRNDPPSDWKSAIKAIAESGIRVGYSDGSLEEGQVEAGWYALGFEKASSQDIVILDRELRFGMVRSGELKNLYMICAMKRTY